MCPNRTVPTGGKEKVEQSLLQVYTSRGAQQPIHTLQTPGVNEWMNPLVTRTCQHSIFSSSVTLSCLETKQWHNHQIIATSKKKLPNVQIHFNTWWGDKAPLRLSRKLSSGEFWVTGFALPWTRTKRCQSEKTQWASIYKEDEREKNLPTAWLGQTSSRSY